MPDKQWVSTVYPSGNLQANFLLNSNPVCNLSKKTDSQMLSVFFVVGVTGFEPTTSWSRTKRATNCATPRNNFRFYYIFNSLYLTDGSAQDTHELLKTKYLTLKTLSIRYYIRFETKKQGFTHPFLSKITPSCSKSWR